MKNSAIQFLFLILLTFKKSYQKLVGRTTNGARAVIINDKDEVLLVMHTYTPGWHFPGGGVDKGESPREAVIREVREEAGVIVQENPVIFECYFNIYGGVDDIVSLYIIKKFQIQKIKSKEIAEVKWFPINRLPENASKATKRRIAEIFFNLEKSERW